MEQRGRKSLENLSVVVSIPGQRPEPPQVLSDPERLIWRQVVGAHPFDWFAPSCWGMLADYCRAWVLSNELALAIAEYDGPPKDSEGFRRWNRLLERRDKNARLLATLGTKMRITNQSTRTERQAATGVRNTPAGKPWDYDIARGT